MLQCISRKIDSYALQFIFTPGRRQALIFVAYDLRFIQFNPFTAREPVSAAIKPRADQDDLQAGTGGEFLAQEIVDDPMRSEERRVGKECRL